MIGRREFLTASSVVGATTLLGGCGSRTDGVSPPREPIDNAPQEHAWATVQSGAIRGRSAQFAEVPPPAHRWRPGDFVRYVDLSFPGVALNYDDGPSPYNTDPILRVLAKYGVKATFYVVGVNARAWPEILRRIVDEGHEVGNHSVYHTPYRASSLASQIEPNNRIIRDLTGGYVPVSHRAPGLTNGLAILQACQANNMYEAHTTIDSGDWRSPRISSTSIYGNVVRNIHTGALPLQHDGGTPRPTPAAQEPIIVELLRRGYVFHTVTGLVNRGTPRPGGMSYSYQFDVAREPGPDAGATSSASHEIEVDGSMCGYDPTAELLARLDDATLKRVERSRIVEVLADIEEHERAG